MKQYLDVLQNIMKNGVDREDRTGVGTRSLFTQQMRFNLNDGFPAVTTKKLAWKSVVSELLWMIEGSGDERRLAEILYGKSRKELTNKKTIWTANARADYWKSKAKFNGDLGRVYGVQWRDWTYTECFDIAVKESNHTGWNFENIYPVNHIRVKKIDQLANVIRNIKDNPNDRRHIVTAWNSGELDQMALPPCHMIFQFYVANNQLSCHMLQRSCDLFLGIPFNIASYALLTHMIAQVCDLDVNELILTLGDAHVYLNHFDAVNEQLERNPRALPELWLNPDIKNVDDFTMEDIKLVGYVPHDPIKAQMAV